MSTKPFKKRVICEHCQRPTTAESAFERWMRLCDILDSSLGIVRFDLDVLLHRYTFQSDGKGSRLIQAMMFIEVKTRGDKLSESQQDTLSLLNQVLRNRKMNMHAVPRPQVENRPVKAFSRKNGREIQLRLFGGHLLQLSGLSPVDSDSIIWDWKWKLDQDRLIRLLKFELDPDDPDKEPADLFRRRSQPFGQMPRLFPDEEE